MNILLMVLVFVLVAIALLINVLSVFFTAKRLWTLQEPTAPDAPCVATLILPLSGPAESLEGLVAALERQTFAPRRLVISVESETDPAFARASAVAARARLPIQVVVAGLSSQQAQKCRNQQAGLDVVDAEDDVIVFMDGDIMPTDWWLGTLVAPLAANTADVVTGLRWQQVTRHTLGAHVVCMIDRAAFLLPRFKARISRVVWGGSVALSKLAADAMEVRQSLSKTLSDDLSLAEAARNANLRVDTRGELLVPSPASLDIGSAWRFACRQYRIMHIYRPWLWRLSASTISIRLLAWVAILSYASAHSALAWAGVVLAALAITKQFLVGAIARRMGLNDSAGVVAIQLLLGLLQPLVDLFHASVILGAAWTRRMRWGHVDYSIAGPYAITVAARRPFERLQA